jgi:hypothetical protein
MKKTLVIGFILSLLVTVHSYGLVHESANHEPGPSHLSKARGDTGMGVRFSADLHTSETAPVGVRQVITQRHEHRDIHDEDGHAHRHGRDAHKHGSKPKSKYDLRDMRPVDSHKHDHGKGKDHEHGTRSHDKHHDHDHGLIPKAGHAHGNGGPDGDTHESHDHGSHSDPHHHGHDGHEGHSHEGVYDRMWEIGTNG